MRTIDDLAGDDLSQAVKRARLRLGFTQQALALACGLSRQTVAQVEAGTFSDLGVRKLQRMLSVLGLALAVAQTDTAGAVPGSRLARLLAGRALERKRRALVFAGRTLDALRKEGVRASVIGSLAKGKFRADSDVDFLVEERAGLSEPRILGIVEAAMGRFPFDVTFAERADPRLLAMMREEARRGAPAIRAA